MKKLMAILLTVVLIMTVTACGDSKSSEDLVKVGDTVIDSQQLDEYVALVAFLSGADISQMPEESLQAIKVSMLNNLIELELLKQHYEDKQDEVLPETFDEDLKSFLDQAQSEESIKTYLDENKISDDTLKTFYYSQYYAQAFLEEAEKEISDLDQEVKDYYEENRQNYLVNEIRASHILIKDEQHKPESKAKAEEALQKVKAGADFAEVAKEYSDDGTKDQGGDLGWFGKGRMVAEFENAAYALQNIDDISEIVETEFGYHIIKLTGKREYRSLEDVEESIKQILAEPIYEENMEKMKKKVGVEYLSDTYKPATEDKTDTKKKDADDTEKKESQNKTSDSSVKNN